MKKYIITVCLALALSSTAFAEQEGKWTIYKSFNNISEIAPAGSMCFALADGSLFSYNTATGETAVYDKTNSLSDINIKHMRWAKGVRKLVIAYENSNIDLLDTDGTVTNLPDLYMKTTSEDKTVNYIYIDGNNAYLALGLGVMKVDLKRNVVVDTYQLGFGVDYCYTKDGYVYAASKDKGLYRGKLSDNILDKSKWERTADYTPLDEDLLNVKDETTNEWWTRNDDGKLTYYTVGDDGQRTYKTEGILPEGPASNNFFRLYTHGGKLYATGGFWNQELNGNYPGEVHVWDGTAWEEFEKPSSQTSGHDYKDVLCMDFDPKKEGHVMVGAKSGMYEFQDGKFIKCYDRSNSPLESPVNSENYVIVTGMKYMSDGNIFVLNSHIEDPIKIYTPSTDSWQTMKHEETHGDYLTYCLDGLQYSASNSCLWFVNSRMNYMRIYAYNYSNDKLAVFGPTIYNQDGAAISTSKAYTTAEDKEHNMWIGTFSGPIYMTTASMSDGSGLFTQYKVPRNDGTNLADYLLNGIPSRCIATDGANRKWIGTSSNGVFLISADNNTQVQHFTTSNSPLMSNMVYDVAVDPNSNIVYFATDRGLCSYASDATAPNEEMTKDNVWAYPNPVSPDYTGYINIVGLGYNADVKIVTSNGTLVNQGRSTGGTYKWNGCDTRGKRVASGVYMVETATQDGQKGTVCKIAVIK